MPIGTIGKYERLDVLGHGASGMVTLARDTLLGRTVALKEIRAAGPERDRVKQEARLLDRLRHPNIVRVHSMDDIDGTLLIDMELVVGRNLAEILRDRAGAPLPLPQALHVMTGLLDALAYAHGQRILHRDVKPGNLLVGADGATIKLTDFGLAEALGSHSVAAGGGTYPYMAPEDFDETAGSDRRSDLWSAGVVLYELLTGRRPFAVERTKDPFAWKRAVDAQTPPPPSTLVPDLPAALDAVVATALARAKEDRYPDAEAFLEALHRAAGTVARPLPPFDPPAYSAEAATAVRHRGPEYHFPDGFVARTLDELLVGLARNWEHATRALMDGTLSRQCDRIGEPYIADLARQLASAGSGSPDRRLREFLERSQAGAEPDDGAEIEPATVVAPTVGGEETVFAKEGDGLSEPRANGDSFRWWYLPVWAFAVAPAVLGAMNVADVSGTDRYLARLLASMACTGLVSAMLLLVGIGLRVPLWARALCVPPAILGVAAGGVLAWWNTVSATADSDRFSLVAALAIGPVGILLIEAATARRLWRGWLLLLLAFGAVAIRWTGWMR
ncbi:MAG: serine/threonine-protein kinase [Armatimonadota bacterium]